MDTVREKIKRSVFVKKYSDGNHVKLEMELIFWAGTLLTPTTPDGISPEVELYEREMLCGDIENQLYKLLNITQSEGQ